MFGCSSCPVIRASLMNRWSSSFEAGPSIVFIATRRSSAASFASSTSPIPPTATILPMSYFFSRSIAGGSACPTNAVAGESESSDASRRSRRSSIVAAPHWTFWFGLSRVRPCTGLPFTRVPFDEPRSSMNALS